MNPGVHEGEERGYQCRMGCAVDASRPCGVRHGIDCQTNHHDPERPTFLATPPTEERPVSDDDEPNLTIYFNPFAFTIEENNAFLAAGYEVMPMKVPDV